MIKKAAYIALAFGASFVLGVGVASAQTATPTPTKAVTPTQTQTTPTPTTTVPGGAPSTGFGGGQ